jgi:hypothetical protein
VAYDHLNYAEAGNALFDAAIDCGFVGKHGATFAIEIICKGFTDGEQFRERRRRGRASASVATRVLATR